MRRIQHGNFTTRKNREEEKKQLNGYVPWLEWEPSLS